MYSQLVHAHLPAVQKDLLWRQTSVLQENLNSSVIILSENKQSWFTFNYFHHDWQVSSLAHIWVNLKQHSSQWNNITKSTKLHNRFQCHDHTFISYYFQTTNSQILSGYFALSQRLWKTALSHFRCYNTTMKCVYHELIFSNLDFS